ncbi:zinc transporter 9-like [Octopus sinensis]|uniref:Proton-coupled zinc antiporter SLC30A9, mitochondrial n=1 Tax=Octopus sinensis TaxID=2607531 RepID=A0A6P7U3F6_9MOLL|nr:zinc transporter 9-like [Octopus sinensis]
MNEYLLVREDLDKLQKFYRRNPYDQSYPFIVYLRQDIEEFTIKKFGSLEKFKIESQKRRISPKKSTTVTFRDFVKNGSGKVVSMAIIVNSFNFLFKSVAYIYCGSHSMFAEAVHSLVDTLNQILLAVGLHQAMKKPDFLHPYGYVNLRYISSLVGGVGILFFGTGLTLYNGLLGLIHPEEPVYMFWALFILIGSFLSELSSFIVAYREIRQSSKARNIPIFDYITLGIDPNVTVVLLEDMAGIGGVTLAGICMFLTYWTGSILFDVLGCVAISLLLSTVGVFIVRQNAQLLMGKSVSIKVYREMRTDLENDRVIRAVHDIKAIECGQSNIHFKAEIDFDGYQITDIYLKTTNLDNILMEIKQIETTDELKSFLLFHGKNSIDQLGQEVDRIEKILKSKHPNLRHVDLEVL